LTITRIQKQWCVHNEFISLGKALASLSNLQNLSLDLKGDNSVTYEGLGDLSQGLKNLSLLKIFTFKAYMMIDKGSKTFSQSLQFLDSVTENSL